jgi:hypothetical protein
MKGSLENEKGTLIHVFIKFEDGRVLEIHPLHNDVGIILFDIEASKDINFSHVQTKRAVVGINHEGEVVGQYDISSRITSLQNTVLYPDGRVWIGLILEEYENKAEWMVLTEKALNLLKDPSGFSFDAPTGDKRPTVLVKLNSSVLPECGSHRCGSYCGREGKFIENSADRTVL